MRSHEYDVVVIGAGAAGLMCALTAGQRGRRVLVIDHARRIGTKIRISGGGRCNFTNLNTAPRHYISKNPHFCKSALKQYTQFDFIELVESHGIPYHEKKLGQLFCDNSAQDIVDLLLKECDRAKVEIIHPVTVQRLKAKPSETHRYLLETSQGEVATASLVIATGGLSIPKSGATGFGYDIARQFGLSVVETQAGLVPLTFQGDFLDRCRTLSGLSVEAKVSTTDAEFAEGLLFTHRGLSGPSILQISSYWSSKLSLEVDLCPKVNLSEILVSKKRSHPKQQLETILSQFMPKRLVQSQCEARQMRGRLGDLTDRALAQLGDGLNRWSVKPGGTEGYRTAEVTLGGVDTQALSSKTMEARQQPGLFFIGEVVDVTGHLGGFNFQWAWSSGYVAGQNA